MSFGMNYGACTGREQHGILTQAAEGSAVSFLCHVTLEAQTSWLRNSPVALFKKIGVAILIGSSHGSLQKL